MTESDPRAARRLPAERLYLWLALPLGVLFALVNPPFLGVPDELQHYYKSLALAQGVFRPVETTALEDYVYLRASLASSDMRSQAWREVRVDALVAGLTERPSEERARVPIGVGFAPPIAYLPQALVLGVGMRSRAPPLVAFYLARLSTLALAVWLVHRAVRVAPFGKRAFAFVGLLPMSVHQLASLSYDSLHIAALLLLIAQTLALAGRGSVLDTRAKLGLFLLALLATNAKPGYFLVAGVLFVLPRDVFPTAGARWRYAAGTVLACAATLVLARAMFGARAPGEGPDPGAQAAHILSDPLEFLAVLARTIGARAGMLLEGLVIRPGRTEALEPPFYVFAVLGGAVLLWMANEAVALSRRQRLVLLATAVLQGLLVFLSLYVCCTRVAAEQVNGVQGRYFLALLPCVLLPLHRAVPRRSSVSPRHADVAFAAYALLLVGYALLRIWTVHYT